MRRRFFKCPRTLGLALLLPSSAFAADVPGSADIADIGRFEGSEIVSYDTEDYGRTVFATGPVRSEADIDPTANAIEGEMTRIVYRVPPGSSALEVFRNFETRIGEAGYETVFTGGSDEIDRYLFANRHPVEILDGISLGNELWYLSARKSSPQAENYLSLLVSPHSGGDGLRVRLIGAATKAMGNRMIDAEAMQVAIHESGKVALYGIYFDTDSATLEPESGPTLEQIAALMQDSPQLAVIVVGHTDNQGGFDYNRDLSLRRAKAVADALVSDYSIDAARIRHDGVGYLAPAASNDSEAGRTLNRRVELVKE